MHGRSPGLPDYKNCPVTVRNELIYSLMPAGHSSLLETSEANDIVPSLGDLVLLSVTRVLFSGTRDLVLFSGTRDLVLFSGTRDLVLFSAVEQVLNMISSCSAQLSVTCYFGLFRAVECYMLSCSAQLSNCNT